VFHLTAKILKSKAGFTLIELLIYVGLLSLTSGFLISILAVTARIQNRQISSYEVTSQSSFALDYIKRAVRESSAIENEPGKTLSYIKLRAKNPQKDPTYIVLIGGGQIQIKEGANASTTITTNKISVDNLQFTKFVNYPGHDALQINLTASYNTQNPQFNFSQTFASAISRVSAATFDDSLTPGTNNTFDLGQPLVNWRNAFFGGNLTVDTNTLFVDSLNNRVGVGTLSPGWPLTVTADNPSGATRATQFVIQGSTNPNLRLNIGVHTEDASPYADIGFIEQGASWKNIVLAKNGGVVGIGTSSLNPTTKLVVAGSAEFTNQGERIEIAGDGTSPAIKLVDTDATDGTQPYIAFSNGIPDVTNDMTLQLIDDTLLQISGGNFKVVGDAIGDRLCIGSDCRDSWSGGSSCAAVTPPANSAISIPAQCSGEKICTATFRSGSGGSARVGISTIHQFADNFIFANDPDTGNLYRGTNGDGAFLNILITNVPSVVTALTDDGPQENSTAQWNVRGITGTFTFCN